MSAAISFEGGAGRGTLWLKSETATVHNRLSMVLATRAVLSIAYVFVMRLTPGMQAFLG